MKGWLKKICSREDDLFRFVAVSGIALFLFWLFVINPICESVERKAFLKRCERMDAESAARKEEWDKKTDDEKFVWCVMDMAGEESLIRGVDVDDTKNSIYIKCITDKTIRDDLSAEKEYIKAMTEFARASAVTKNIYFQGWNINKEVAWMIDEYGNVF